MLGNVGTFGDVPWKKRYNLGPKVAPNFWPIDTQSAKQRLS
jgi:hypothetical protein